VLDGASDHRGHLSRLGDVGGHCERFGASGCEAFHLFVDQFVRLATSATPAPASSNRRAVANPMSRLAPVTRALPAMFFLISMPFVGLSPTASQSGSSCRFFGCARRRTRTHRSTCPSERRGRRARALALLAVRVRPCARGVTPRGSAWRSFSRVMLSVAQPPVQSGDAVPKMLADQMLASQVSPVFVSRRSAEPLELARLPRMRLS
jgi:hypothetical protein